ncbi:hypothetical protein JB92DRAFT_2997379 [Gautieria morchelliformis]|nr:hypothetical protein JB92DRAFT_2997379 [Gautieria morchelliformis]
MPLPAPLRSWLEICPAEVLEGIALATVCENQPGPPADIASLLRVSKSIFFTISMENNPGLYAKIFSIKFDDRAAVRRLGETCRYTRNRANELAKRFRSLKRFKLMACRQFCASPTARDDLWLAYLLFLEHDRHNYQQLVSYAAVDEFASSFILNGGPFHDGVDGNGGWKIDSEINALAAWIFWFTDKDRVANETGADRNRVLTAFAHTFVGSFKYASTHAPITSFHLPPNITPLPLPLSPALPLAARPSSRPTYLQHFGLYLSITPPLLTPAALLSCAVRLETEYAETGDDLAEQKQPTTKFAEWGQDGGSERHEHDWTRLLTCYSPWTQPVTRRGCVFTPGMVTGTWVGRMFEIPRDEYDALLAPDHFAAAPTPPLLCVYPKPMQFDVCEYHAHDDSQKIGYNDLSTQGSAGDGVLMAWWPRGVVMDETERKLYLSSNNPLWSSTYDIFDPVSAARRTLDNEYRRTGPYTHGVYDIIITATTGAHLGHKWFYGRVRDWDGLILLVSVEPPLPTPTRIFSGYIHGNMHLVGRWRETATPVDQPGWEGVWSMTKVE